tara:strand:- start:1049 stop:1609 length:561 start_codon:yes stop_codon:yes gene_type:complete
MNIEDMIAEDSKPKVDKNLSDNRLKDVSFWAEKQVELETNISELEASLSSMKKEFREISEQKLPDAMRECNLSEIKLSNGTKISVQEFYSARISKEQQENAFSWLKENGHEDIIKNVVSVNFGRGEDGRAETLLDTLQSKGLSPATKRWVEPMTLKAFVREQVQKGVDLPFETFNVYVGQKSKISN